MSSLKSSFILCLLILVANSCSKDDGASSASDTNRIFFGDKIISSQEELDLFGTEKYSVIKGDLKISGVNNLEALSDLEAIEGALLLGRWDTNDHLFNPELASLKGLDKLVTINGAFTIHGTLIKNLNGLNNLETVEGLFDIYNNSNLENIDDVSKLSQVGHISVVTNDKLESIDSFKNIKGSVISVVVSNNAVLLNLEGLENITDVESIIISENDLLTNLVGLDNLSSVSAEFRIEKNAGLLSLEGVQNLKNVNGDLNIIRNWSLENYCALLNTSFNGGYSVFINQYNPSQEQLHSNQECSE